jgi:hypothetical protein
MNEILLSAPLSEQPEVLAAITNVMLSPLLWGVLCAVSFGRSVFGQRTHFPFLFIAFAAVALLFSAAGNLPLSFVVGGIAMAVSAMWGSGLAWLADAAVSAAEAIRDLLKRRSERAATEQAPASMPSSDQGGPR